MRKENYLIAMLNKGILKLSLPLPFLGSRGSGTLWATTGRQYLTKSLEWSVHFCVLNHMFSEKVRTADAFAFWLTVVRFVCVWFLSFRGTATGPGRSYFARFALKMSSV